MTDAIGPASVLKLRSDLRISTVREAGKDYHYVKDPVSRRFYRLRGNEYRIAVGLDGRRNLDALFQSLPSEDGLSFDEVVRFTDNLQRLGLLVGGTGPVPITLSKRRNPSLLFMKLPLVNPDRFLTRVVPHLGFIFSKLFTGLWIVLLLTAMILYFVNWELMNHAVAALKNGRLIALSLVLLFVLRLLLVSLHELAHAVVCKHYGGSVQEMGFLLLVLQPAFYCDVSDAWLFDRPKRLAVDFAGLQLELLVWAVSVIAWALAPGNPVVEWLAPLLVLITGFDVAINLNPLIRLDGYYLLSDLTGIPNLRSHAFGMVLTPFRRLFRRPATEIPPLSRWRRPFLWVFGIVSLLYTALLVVFMVFVLIGIIVKYLAYATGFVAVIWLLNLLYRRRRERNSAGASA